MDPSFGNELLQFLDPMSRSRLAKRLMAVVTPREIGFEHGLEQPWQFLKRDSVKDFAPERLAANTLAAEQHMITFHLVAVLRDFRPEQANVADVMLRARIRAAGQM